MIYTHSHGDHFGGVRGVTDGDACRSSPRPGSWSTRSSENVYAGAAMTRRAVYMYGADLPKGPAGQIGAGLGMTTSTGTIALIPPTLDITHTGQEETVDGVRIVFQLTPGTEAPAEMNFHFPERRALCMAENATHNLHNLLTLRGALVRDPRIWARYLTEAIELFADGTDVAFASHHWPTWGRDRIVRFLSEQRDLYAYLHDQTLRLMNQGYTGIEIAELIELPPALERAWHTRGYYGSVSHNVKAIYQRYLGWFDGNPAHLWQHPPVETAQRYVDCIGGVDAVVAKARDYADAGRPAVRGRAAQPRGVRRRRTTPTRQGAAGLGLRAAGLRRGERHLAQLLPDGRRWSCAAGSGSARSTSAGGMADRARRSSSSSTRSRSGSTARGPGTEHADHRLGVHRSRRGGADDPVERRAVHGPPAGDGADLTLTLTKPQLFGLLGGAGLAGHRRGRPVVLQPSSASSTEPDPDFAIVTP